MVVVILKATHIVQPAEVTPDEIMYFTASDQIEDIAHTPTVYIYRNSLGDAVSRLKDSLSKALVLFYPLAGRLDWAAQGGSRVELHCNGKGVPLFEAESEATIEDLGDFAPTPAMHALIPRVDYTTPIHDIPLVSVQLTTFRCGGVSIGLGVSHVVADGPSALHFVDEWAKIARGGAGPTMPPFLDRTVLLETPRRDNPSAAAFDEPPTLIGDNMENVKPITKVALLNLSKTQIEKLREKANLDFGGRGCSRFEAVAAHIWRCTSKARCHVAEQETSLFLVADFRKKLQPPLPGGYFGNALIRVKVTDNAGNLLSSPIGAASKKIREVVESVTDEAVGGYLEYLKGLEDVGEFRSLDKEGQPKELHFGNPNLGIISWTRLPLYGADFGWGKEMYMGPGSTGFEIDGKTFIIPSHHGDDSFNVAIWLQEQHVDAFKKCFYLDIP